jgi:hypothetical protein
VAGGFQPNGEIEPLRREEIQRSIATDENQMDTDKDKGEEVHE